MKFKRWLKRPISLHEIKAHADELDGFRLIARGNRLSIMPVDKAHWDVVVGLEDQPAP